MAGIQSRRFPSLPRFPDRIPRPAQRSPLCRNLLLIWNTRNNLRAPVSQSIPLNQIYLPELCPHPMCPQYLPASSLPLSYRPILKNPTALNSPSFRLFP